jgi:hypothetical protein
MQMRISRGFLGGLAAAALIATTGSAFADHGKAGLWQVTTTASMPGMAAHTFSSQQCMTEAEVKSDKLPQTSQNQQCKMTNEKVLGSSFSADMVCTGQAKGTGHMSVVYDGATHYNGQMTMAMNAGGRPMSMTNTFEGKWVSADCGKAAH